MTTVYKLFVQGRQDTQQIGQVLYYGLAIPSNLSFNPLLMTALAANWWTTNAVTYLDFLPPAYSAEQIVVSLVDEGNRVVSPFEVIVPISGVGTGNGESFSAGSTFIIGFAGTPYGGDFLPKVPKRSYIAYGPATENLVDRTGLVLLTAPQRSAIEDVFENPVIADGLEFLPLRIGTFKAVGATSASIVAQATFRDYASFRKSRMIRPTGA